MHEEDEEIKGDEFAMTDDDNLDDDLEEITDFGLDEEDPDKDH